MRSPFLATLSADVQARVRRHGLRNVALLTVPPVGSGAALAGTTSGVEPIFDLAYTRRSESLSQEYFKVYHPLVKTYMDRFGLTDEAELPPVFVTAHKIRAEMRVRMQAAIQKHIDHSISSTVNLPESATLEDVANVYLLAWKLGCKGITVYREGSREGVLITDAKMQQQTQPTQAAPAAAEPARGAVSARPRPKVTHGRTERIETPRGRIYVTINEDELGTCEIFVESLDAEAEAIGRLASLSMRSGVDAREVIEQLWRVQSKEMALDRAEDGTVVRVTTISQAIALALGRMLYGDSFRPDKAFPRATALPEPLSRARQERLRFHDPSTADAAEGAVPQEQTKGNGHANGHGNGGGSLAFVGEPLSFVGLCPDCGDSLAYENGCATCRSCGYSKC
jgi:ribonucleoside-diphosphate reductase alpha chain